MNKKSKYGRWLVFTSLLLISLAIIAFLSILTGEVKIRISAIPKILEAREGMEFFILTKIRIPRTVLAITAGGALGLTGAILQGIFRNPLVEPYTLGISGGASLGVTLVIISGLHQIYPFALPVAGFTGALLTIVLVYTLGISHGSNDINRMLLIGVMISFVASSVGMLLMSLTSTDQLHSIVFWIMGSLDEPNTNLIRVMAWISSLGLLVSYLFARPLNALQLGQLKAGHLGINAGTSIRILFIVSSLMAGVSVSVAGIIGFVGLIIPHLVRWIVGSDYRFLLIGSFLGGGIFLTLSDMIARTILAPVELPIGVITGIAGGIVFMIILSNIRKKGKSV